MTDWRMPAEWERHDRTWMAWPSSGYTLGATDEEADDARRTWAAVARAVARFEPVTMVVTPPDVGVAREHLGTGSEHEIDIVEADLDEVVADLAVRSLCVIPVQLEPMGDRTVEFTQIAIDLQVAAGEIVIIHRHGEQVLEDRDQIDIEVREASFELQPRQMRVDLGPSDPLTIIVDGVVVIPHVGQQNIAVQTSHSSPS